MKKRLALAAICLLSLGGCNFDIETDFDFSRLPDQETDPDPGQDPGDGTPGDAPPPNILFIVIDDAGVDQFEAMGYGGAIPPRTASINAIAQAGVRFRNTWSMPTCSPSRSTFFEGRYPFRSGVRNAIVSTDLANSQVSPYTLTTPKLLKEKAGYVNALIGKMHLTGSDLGPDNHPLGDGAMRELGWDYFAGYLDGAPYPIDTTAGGVAPEGTYQCGFIPNTLLDPENGADYGVCYLADGSHLIMDHLENYPTPGRTCVEMGGILDPLTTTFSPERRAELDFAIQNGYYTAAWKINRSDGGDETIPPSDPRARGYRTVKETDQAIGWIHHTQSQSPNTPWMLSLGYSALHAPLQPPPASLLPSPDADLSLLGCGTPAMDRLAELGLPVSGDLAEFAQQRAVAQHMLEAVDHEIGRLLVETGIAVRNEDGSLEYDPDSNTVVIITSDNGTYMPTVRLPFDPLRAKGTLYQSGIWVPLIVAGPPSVVSAPDRDVPHMVNITDLYSLFRELAGIDESELPSWLQLDAQPVLPYLEEPDGESLRDINFSEQGTNLSSQLPPPCVIPASNMCVQIFPQEAVCEDQSGVWYGPGSKVNPEGFSSCCAVNAYLESEGQEPTVLFPHQQRAIRDASYKLVRVSRFNCETEVLEDSDEFYEINESTDPDELKLDRADLDLLADRTPAELPEEPQAHYEALNMALDQLLASAVTCPGDGNGDMTVDDTDLEEWAYWSDPERGGGLSSWYDLDHDGITDENDLDIINQNLGNDCHP